MRTQTTEREILCQIRYDLRELQRRGVLDRRETNAVGKAVSLLSTRIVELTDEDGAEILRQKSRCDTFGSGGVA